MPRISYVKDPLVTYDYSHFVNTKVDSERKQTDCNQEPELVWNSLISTYSYLRGINEGDIRVIVPGIPVIYNHEQPFPVNLQRDGKRISDKNYQRLGRQSVQLALEVADITKGNSYSSTFDIALDRTIFKELLYAHNEYHNWIKLMNGTGRSKGIFKFWNKHKFYGVIEVIESNDLPQLIGKTLLCLQSDIFGVNERFIPIMNREFKECNLEGEVTFNVKVENKKLRAINVLINDECLEENCSDVSIFIKRSKDTGVLTIRRRPKYVQYDSKAYGDSFERYITSSINSDADGFWEIHSFNFGSLRLMLRCEVDAVTTKNKDIVIDPQELNWLSSTTSQTDKIESSKNIQNKIDRELNIKECIQIDDKIDKTLETYIAKFESIEIKSLSEDRNIPLNEYCSQLNLGQTKSMVLGRHKHGTFEVKPEIIKPDDQLPSQHDEIVKSSKYLESFFQTMLDFTENHMDKTLRVSISYKPFVKIYGPDDLWTMSENLKIDTTGSIDWRL